MAKYVEAIEKGKCLMSTNAVEFVPGDQCDCCSPDYTIQEEDFDKYSIYQLLKDPVPIDIKPEVSL